MASGLYIISTPFKGAEELLGRRGERGTLFYDCKDFEIKISQYLESNMENKMSIHTGQIEFIRNHYDSRTLSTNFNKLINDWI